MTEYFTVKEVAVKLKLKPLTIYRMIENGHLKAFRTRGDRGSYRITQEQIDECVQNMEKK